jgi:hypothetical protein
LNSRGSRARGPAHSTIASNLTNVARRIRPHVEEYVRHKYRRDFRDAATLGECIEIIKLMPTAYGVGGFKPKISDPEDINSFGSRFMHSDGQPAPPPSEAELQAFAERAIDWFKALDRTRDCGNRFGNG